MSLILNIDTALDVASISLAKEKDVLEIAFNRDQQDHAAWLHTAIAELVQKTGHVMKDLKAVAVSIGPGSYTGLRVGLATAKGFCYALQIPLVVVNTLKLMAYAAKDEATDLICPMIDARRMEVFTALYDKNIVEKIPPHSLVIDENSIRSLLSENKIIVCGNALKKIKPFISNSHVTVSDAIADASHLAGLSFPLFINKKFADLAYTEPFYLKEFYSPAQKR